jgi:hypothetical protein
VLEEIEHAHNLRKTMIPIFQERYAPPSQSPNGHVEALLQHDGIHILDVRNIYMDQAIAELASMIKKSAPQLRMGAPGSRGAVGRPCRSDRIDHRQRRHRYARTGGCGIDSDRCRSAATNTHPGIWLRACRA